MAARLRKTEVLLVKDKKTEISISQIKYKTRAQMCRLENTFVQTLPSPLRQPIKPPTCGRGYKVVLYAAAPGHVNNNNYGNVVRQFNEYFLLLQSRES